MGDYCLHVNTDIGLQCLLDRDHLSPHQYPSEERDGVYCHGCGETVPREVAYRDAGRWPFHWNAEGGGHFCGKEAYKPVPITEEALTDQPNIVQQIQSGRLNQYRSGPPGAAVTDPERPMKETVASRLNAALSAVYANTGPSPVLVEIRAAMALLGVEETRGT